MEQELIEITVGANYNKRAEIFAWAKETFGDQVEQHADFPILYFRNKADAEFFMLRWS